MKIRLKKNLKKFALYQVTIDKDFSKNYIRHLKGDKIPSAERNIPEHGVSNSNKRGKLRRISNAKSKSKLKGICIKDTFPTEPELLWNLLRLITRFRERKRPITTDAEGMYKQFSISPEDRKKFCFFLRAEAPEYFEYTRVVFGAKSSPSFSI